MPAESLQKHLLDLWDKFAPGLAQSLEARMKDRQTALQKKLAERANKEYDDMVAIFGELQKAIDNKLSEQEDPQQLSLFNEQEKEQHDRNHDFLRSRMKSIPLELAQETEAIKARYKDPQPRMFPVSVTFLVPEKMRRG